MIAYFEAQGSLLHLKVRGHKSAPTPHSHKRGIIRTFSQASRRRLMRFMARLKVRKIRATFITLTFSGVPNVAEAKRAFKQFSMRLRRLFPQASVVWRMEFQERKSAHFHLLCFNLPFWKQAEVQMAWEACTGEVRSIVDIRLVHGARSVMSYVSKYIAKVADDLPSASLDDGSYQHGSAGGLAGRFWGWINKNALPLGQKLEGVLTDRLTIKDISAWAWKLSGADNTYQNISFHLFADNAEWFWHMFIERGGMDMDEWRWSRYLSPFEQAQADYVDLEWSL